MARRRFFVPVVRGGEAELLDDDAKHLIQVLRVEAGEVYEISDNDSVYLAEVEQARKSRVAFRILERLPSPEPQPDITLLLALVKFDRLESAIEKATELGVSEIRVVRTERSEKGLDQAVPKRMVRWRRIAMEASQQSRRARMPEFSGPVKLDEALRTQARYRLFLDEDRTGAPLLGVITEAASAAILVGPEGGWPEHERAAAREAGWIPVSLGPLVLRTETAATAALAVLRAVFLRAASDGNLRGV